MSGLPKTLLFFAMILCAASAVAEIDPICLMDPLENDSSIVCEAYIPSFTYNKESGVCESYIYGGCFGSENLFDTEEQCKKRCMVNE